MLFGKKKKKTEDDTSKKGKFTATKKDVITAQTVGATLFLFGLFLLYFFATGLGDLGGAVQAFLFGTFGFGSIFIVIGLFYLSVRLFIGKSLVKIKRFVLFLSLFIFSMLLTIHSFMTSCIGLDYGQYVAKCYAAGASGIGTSAGWFGALFTYPLMSGTHNIAAYLVFILCDVLFFWLTTTAVLKHYNVQTVDFKKLFSSFKKEKKTEQAPLEETAPSFTQMEQERQVAFDRTEGEQRPIYYFQNQYDAPRQTEKRIEDDRYGKMPEPYSRPVNVNTATPETKSSYPAYQAENTHKETSTSFIAEPQVNTPETWRAQPIVKELPKTIVQNKPQINYSAEYAKNLKENAKDYDTTIRFLYGNREDPDEYRSRNLIFDSNSKYNNRNFADAQNGNNPSYSSMQTETRSLYREEENENGYSYMSDSIANEERDLYMERNVVAQESSSDAYGYDRTAREEIATEENEYLRAEYLEPERTREVEDESISMPFSNEAEEPEQEEETISDRFDMGRDFSDPVQTDRESFAAQPSYEFDRNERVEEDTDRRSEFTERFESYREQRDRSRLFEDDYQTEEVEEVAEERPTPSLRRDFDLASSDRMGSDRTATPDRMSTAPVKAPEPPKKEKRVIKPYIKPPIDLLESYAGGTVINNEEIDQARHGIVDTLAGFNIVVSIERILTGPVFTRYDISLPKSVDFSKIVRYKREISLAIHSENVNIYANYSNGTVSIEVPNKIRSTVGLKAILSDDQYVNSKAGKLMFAVGKDAEGKCVLEDLCSMPHMLVAGTTGSGKSIFLHGLIISLLMKYSPEEMRLILIDPKWTEFSVYENLPHLMINEIISDSKRAIVALNWAVAEMEHRYMLFGQMCKKGINVRDIDSYNKVVTNAEEKLPKIVIVADELADLMATAKADVELRISRIAAKARACGIHLVLATQRPSADVVTGVLKSNLSSRFALRVDSELNSRIILDRMGAEKLLGKGDLLYKAGSMTEPLRVQGAWVSPAENQRICDFIRENNESYFDEEITRYIDSEGKIPVASDGNGEEEEEREAEPVYIDALRFVVKTKSASISMIQRKCSVGFGKAGKIIEWMEKNNYISPFEGAKARKVLLTEEEFIEKYGDE